MWLQFEQVYVCVCSCDGLWSTTHRMENNRHYKEEYSVYVCVSLSLSLSAPFLCVSLSPSFPLSLSLSHSRGPPVLVHTKRLELMIFSYHGPNGWSPYLVCVFYITPVPSSIWKWVDLEWCLPMTGMILQRRERERERRRERERGRGERDRGRGQRKEEVEREGICLFHPPPPFSLSISKISTV